MPLQTCLSNDGKLHNEDNLSSHLTSNDQQLAKLGFTHVDSLHLKDEIKVVQTSYTKEQN